jgi:Mce-associated membrane protein
VSSDLPNPPEQAAETSPVDAETEVAATPEAEADATVEADAATSAEDADATVKAEAAASAAGGVATPETDAATPGAKVAATLEPEAAAVPEAAATPEGASSTLRTVITYAAAAWLIVAVIAGAWFGVGWVRAAFFTDAPRAQARDSALDAARQATLNLTSMNPSDVDGSMKLMQSSMTGQMLDEFNQNHDKIKQTAEQSRTKLEAKVLGASLTSLDSERSKASAIVVVQQTQTAPNTPVQSFRATWTLDMSKVGDTWKADQANSLGQLIPLDNTGAAPSPAQPQQPGQPQPAPTTATPTPAAPAGPGS